MKNFKSFTILLLLLIGVAGARSFAGDLIRIANHVVVDRKTSIPGNQLCHDGAYVFLKQTSICEKPVNDGTCPELRVAPIRELETVQLEWDQKVVRLNKVELDYNLNVYQKTITPGGGFELSLDDSTPQKMESCRDRPAIGGLVIQTKPRRPVDSTESRFLRHLHNSGFNVINSLRGALTDFHLLEMTSPNLNLHQIKDELKLRNISSPICNPNAKGIALQLMGGELTGNGIIAPTDFDFIQRESFEIRPMFPEKNGKGQPYITCSHGR